MKNTVMPAPSSIKDYYYKKWDNFYCCYQSSYHNLGAAWPAFGGIHQHITTDVIVVPYDAIKFKTEYSLHTLDEHLEHAKQSGMFVIIDKTVEHVHDDKDFAELYNNLKSHQLLDRCVVFDNTKDETMFKKYGVPHAYAPWYVWFYVFFKRLPKYVASPEHQFLCLNNFDKPHRYATIQMLHDKKYIKRTHWSYRQQISPNSQEKLSSIYPNIQAQKTLFETPHYIDQPQQQFDQEQNIETLHTNALCTIVTETDYLYAHTQFATEKSWHSLFYGTIPVIVSCKGTVNLMREHGLDVFDDLLTHSYDEESDTVKRFDSIAKAIEQCASWRNYNQIRNITAARHLRNQILLTHDQHWINEIDYSVGQFFTANKISI